MVKLNIGQPAIASAIGRLFFLRETRFGWACRGMQATISWAHFG